MAHAVLGHLSIDPIGVAVSEVTGKSNPGYQQFSSPFGIDGLAKEENGTLEILAVSSSNPGKGQFRAFINRAQSVYRQIQLIEVWNPRLDATLERWGFKKVEMMREGEHLTGRRWTK